MKVPSAMDTKLYLDLRGMSGLPSMPADGDGTFIPPNLWLLMGLEKTTSHLETACLRSIEYT
jgi:hypothetical protein